MCGRYASFRQSQQIAREFDVVTLSQAAAEVEPSWNIPPTTMVRILIDRPKGAVEQYSPAIPVESPAPPTLGSTPSVSDSAVPSSISGRSTSNSPYTRSMQVARWGLVPPWAESLTVGSRMINARTETAATKPSFRKPFSTSRCIVVADGYYEWHKEATGPKTPFYIAPSNGDSLAFAGLFSWWLDRDQTDDSKSKWILTTTILTSTARDGLEEIHDREPVMLRHDLITDWLDPSTTDPATAMDIISHPGPALSWHPVSSAVGSVRNDWASLIDPLPHQPEVPPLRPPNGGSALPPDHLL